jgi:putative ABC transport system permease protein
VKSAATFLFFSLCLSVSVVYPSEPEVLINQLLANRLHARQGDVIQISESGDMRNSKSFRVGGIFQEKADPYIVPLRRSLIKMHLSDLEGILGKNDEVDLISIQLKNGVSAGHFAARLNSESIGFTSYSAQELAQRSSTTFQVVSRFHKAIALITMLAGAIFIFALMVMRVEDQRKNLAILNVTGISKRTILQALVLESTCFASLASLLGAAIGYGAALLVNVYYQRFYQTTLTFARVTPDILLQAGTIAFILGIFAGTFSWFRLKKLAVLQELGR